MRNILLLFSGLQPFPESIPRSFWGNSEKVRWSKESSPVYLSLLRKRKKIAFYIFKMRFKIILRFWFWSIMILHFDSNLKTCKYFLLHNQWLNKWLTFFLYFKYQINFVLDSIFKIKEIRLVIFFLIILLIVYSSY